MPGQLSTVLNPTDPTRSRYLSSMGRRMSPSTSTTLCSASASANAMLIAVVDLALVRHRTGDDDHARRIVDREELQVGPKFAECFSNGGVVGVERYRRLLSAFLVERNAADEPDAGDLLEHLSILDGVVEQIAEDRKTNSQQHAEHQADGEVAQSSSETTGRSGIDARCSTTTRASGCGPSSGVSNSRTMTTNSSDNVLAMSRARTGDSSRTVDVYQDRVGFRTRLDVFAQRLRRSYRGRVCRWCAAPGSRP